MAGITTIDTILSRIKLLIATYLATETALIDTRNNAVATIDSDTANNFTSPTVAAADIQLYEDHLPGRPVRIIVRDGGVMRSEAFQVLGMAQGATAPDSTLPRLDRLHRVEVSIRVATDGGSDETFWSARLRCNRIAEAVVVILARYVDLGIPSLSFDGIVQFTEQVSDRRAEAMKEEDWQFAERVLGYDVRTIEARA